jgi:hypothetical protein
MRPLMSSGACRWSSRESVLTTRTRLAKYILPLGRLAEGRDSRIGGELAGSPLQFPQH